MFALALHDYRVRDGHGPDLRTLEMGQEFILTKMFC